MASATGTGNGRKAASAGGLRSTFRLRIELWLAVVFMALAFGAGFAVRSMSEPPAQPVVGVAPAANQLQEAPPLTDQQIEQGLPSGHPDISATEPSDAPTPGAEASKGSTGDSGGSGATDGTQESP